jgi:hypothetical protein
VLKNIVGTKIVESPRTLHNLPGLQHTLYYQLSPLVQHNLYVIWPCISEYLIWPHGMRSGPLILASGLGLNSVLVTTHPVLLHHVAKASTRPARLTWPEVFNTPCTGSRTQHVSGFPSCPVGRVAVPRSCPPLVFYTESHLTSERIFSTLTSLAGDPTDIVVVLRV